jgi:hypothetical protein
MIEVPIRSLSRGQREKLQRSKEFADTAEEIVAEEIGLDGLGLDPDWWDLHNEDTGTKHQVKSTSTTIGETYPGDGRFRVWKGQTRSLLSSDARGTAWITFVLLDEDTGSLKIRKMKPSTVWSLVKDRGGWNRSGHEDMGRQHKIPHGEVFE